MKLKVVLGKVFILEEKDRKLLSREIVVVRWNGCVRKLIVSARTIFQLQKKESASQSVENCAAD